MTAEDAASSAGGTFEEFFRAEYVGAYRALYLLTGSEHEAEEVLQQAFCKVWERWQRVRTMQNPSGYLYRIALNEFRSAYRRVKRSFRLLASLHPGEHADALTRSEARLEVLQALASVSPRQRMALVLTEVLGYSSGEAAELMGVAPGAVRTLVARGRAALNRRREPGYE